MMIVQWREQFAHGRAAIDADHRMVVDMINELDVALAVASPPEVVGRALDVLAQRIAEHFRREDAELPAGDGAQLPARPNDHQEILARACRLRDDWRQGACTDFDRGQLLALARWWVSHIGRVN
jgi:hemerythrin-like metal-binding protein